MAEIHAFMPALTTDGARRLRGDLQAMVDAGIDSGPRAPQIRAGGEQLEVLLTALRKELPEHNLSAELATLLNNLERLVQLACNYEVD